MRFCRSVTASMRRSRQSPSHALVAAALWRYFGRSLSESGLWQGETGLAVVVRACLESLGGRPEAEAGPGFFFPSPLRGDEIAGRRSGLAQVLRQMAGSSAHRYPRLHHRQGVAQEHDSRAEQRASRDSLVRAANLHCLGASAIAAKRSY